LREVHQNTELLLLGAQAMDSALSTFTKRTISQGLRGLFFLLISQTAALSFPSNYDADRPVYYFEFLTFRGSQADETFLEIFSQIPTKNLQFINSEDGFYASAEISMTLYDQSNFQVNKAIYIDTVKVLSLDDIETLKPHVIRFVFMIAPGEYDAKFRLTDLETLAVTAFDKKIIVPNYGKAGLQLSALQLASSIRDSKENSVLVKNDRKIVPNVPQVFGMDLDTLYIYSELYNLSYSPDDAKKEFSATYTIKNQKGEAVKSVKLRFKKPGDTSVLSVGIPIHELPSGQYDVVLNVIDQDNNNSIEKSTHFRVVNPLNIFSDREFDKLIRQLRFIASSQELRELRSLPLNERPARIDQFWAERDPTPGTEQNEFKNEYYRRIVFANQNFFNPGGEGWETDQGEIYIKIGPPDYINRFQTDINNIIYEIWGYSELNRKYIFMDKEGFGRFRLMNPLETTDLEFTLY
jgi:GWxTD domain-containing protein